MIRVCAMAASMALLVAGCATVSPNGGAPRGYTPLFNGVDMSGWQTVMTEPEKWHVEADALVCEGAKGFISTEREYSDFALKLEFRLPPDGNSGVFLRVPHEPMPHYNGMEIQVLDDYAPKFANIQPWQHCGSLYGVVPASPRVSKPAGEWQTMEILCAGRKVEVVLNGVKVVDANLDDHADQFEERPGLTRTTGYIGLQGHGTRIEYRDVYVKEIPNP